MPSLQSLPTELLYLILAELDNHRGTLLALQLVSRSVRAASESLLYRTISFPRWNESRLKQLVDTLYWSGERLCHHIDGFRISAREVKISTETGARICEVLKRCVNLSSLSLDFFRKKGNKGSSPFFALLDSAPFSLSTLSWTGLIPKEARLFIDFLASQSSLRYLDLTLPPSQELSCIPLSALPCLQLVRTGEAIDNIAAIFADRPNITHLHLRRVPNSMFSQLAQESVSNIRTLTVDVDDWPLFKLATYMPHLQCLHLNGRIRSTSALLHAWNLWTLQQPEVSMIAGIATGARKRYQNHAQPLLILAFGTEGPDTWGAGLC
ncbi:F-box domain-containing protein [Pleurotus pulmonarius]